jgi:hypothetical protein
VVFFILVATPIVLCQPATTLHLMPIQAYFLMTAWKGWTWRLSAAAADKF